MVFILKRAIKKIEIQTNQRHDSVWKKNRDKNSSTIFFSSFFPVASSKILFSAVNNGCFAPTDFHFHRSLDSILFDLKMRIIYDHNNFPRKLLSWVDANTRREWIQFCVNLLACGFSSAIHLKWASDWFSYTNDFSFDLSKNVNSKLDQWNIKSKYLFSEETFDKFPV